MKNEFDVDKDGVITEKDLDRADEMLEIELKEEKAEFNKKIAMFCIGAIVVLMTVLLFGFVTDTRVGVLSDTIGTFMFAMASLAGAVIGVTSWMNKS